MSVPTLGKLVIVGDMKGAINVDFRERLRDQSTRVLLISCKLDAAWMQYLRSKHGE